MLAPRLVLTSLALAAFAAHHWRAGRQCTQGGTVAIIAVLKNEHDVLEEWLRHHIAEGITSFYIVDNDSAPPLRVGSDLKRSVKITRSAKRYAQVEHLNALADDARAQGHSWILSIDADEYVWPVNNASTVANVLRDLSCSCASVKLPLLNFGDGGLTEMPESVRRGFLIREEGPRAVRGIDAYIENYVYKPHTKRAWKWAARGNQLQSARVHKPVMRHALSKACTTPLIVNHYGLMTYNRFMRIKATRGDVAEREFSNVRNRDYFFKNNKATVYDDRLKQRAARIGA